MTHRIEHIDIAKGISILLVAMFHSELKLFAPDLINSMGLFRMPLFFFLSGVFFSALVDSRTFLWKKSDALLKPYFSTLLSVFIVTVILNENNLLGQFAGIFYGNGDTIRLRPMWFLTHLFAVYCFSYLIFRTSRIHEKRPLYKAFTIIIFLIIGSYFIRIFTSIKINFAGEEINFIGLPFSLDLIFISSAFFMAGAFLKKLVIEFKPNLYLLPICILCLAAIIEFTDAYVDLNARVYDKPLYSTLGAICGIYFVITLSFYMQKVTMLRYIFLKLGQTTLFILIFHAVISSRTYRYLSEWGSHEYYLMYAIIAFLVSVSAPILIKYIVSKSKLLSLIYLPQHASKNNFP